MELFSVVTHYVEGFTSLLYGLNLRELYCIQMLSSAFQTSKHRNRVQSEVPKIRHWSWYYRPWYKPGRRNRWPVNEQCVAEIMCSIVDMVSRCCGSRQCTPNGAAADSPHSPRRTRTWLATETMESFAKARTVMLLIPARRITLP